MVPTIYYFFWVRYHPNKVYSQKKSRQETKYRPSFPPTTKPHPLNPLDRGPTSLVLAGYRLVVLRPFYACSTIFCVCLPHRFCRSKLALFYSATWLCLISSRVSRCVLSFPLVWLFLHAIPAADTSCYPLFLFIMLFHFSSHAYLLYKRIWAFVGQIMLIGSKGSWAQFIFICQSHSARELYSAVKLYSVADLYSVANLCFAIDCFPLHLFLWTFLALRSSWWVLLFIGLSWWVLLFIGHQHTLNYSNAQFTP